MTEFLFFSGKGGVGKTSMACATAVRYADQGHRTLIITTDPASNLADVFEQPIGHQLTSIAAVANLWAMEIDPDQATHEYKERALAPLRVAFPAPMVKIMEEQMSGPCTTEVASFDRFTDFLDNSSGFEVVIFDTAPTGHTLRLIELPVEWGRSINEAEQGSGQTCIGPTAAIQEAKHKYERAVAILRDPSQTRFIFVLQPEATAIQETRRAVAELEKLGIQTHELIINGIIPEAEITNPLFAQRRIMQQRYLAEIQATLLLPSQSMPLLAGEIKGVTRLRDVSRVLWDHANVVVDSSLYLAENSPAIPQLSVPTAVLAKILPQGQRRTLFFAGKGGVGKTVASCVTAVWLAEQGYKTLLLTTDPAAHLGNVLGVPVGDTVAPVPGVPHLWATKIDPKVAGEIYRQRILADARERGRPESALKIMEEELNSPCTEEIAAFDMFIDYASQADWEVVVFDTAPTGHTLRMLELPMEWSKQLDVKVFASVDTVTADDVTKQHFADVIAMMRNPDQSTFAYVMYPEATPILEAERAADELRTLGIEAGLVVANFVLAPADCTTPFTQARRTMQTHYLAEIAERFPVPILQIPLLAHEIQGLALLKTLGQQLYGTVLEPQS